MKLPNCLPARAQAESVPLSATAMASAQGLQPQGCSVTEWAQCVGEIAKCGGPGNPNFVQCLLNAAPQCLKCLPL